MKQKMRKHLNLFQLEGKKLSNVKGGNSCCCACAYENSGGSSTFNNCDANFDGGLESPGCLEQDD